MVCSYPVVMNWRMFRTSRMFHMNVEAKGIMSLLGCSRMAQDSRISKGEALLSFRKAPRDDEAHTYCTTAFRVVISQPVIQDTPTLIISFGGSRHFCRMEACLNDSIKIDFNSKEGGAVCGR
ncbi:unnamed protein product [Hymenolepis diminuta]|uniref:Uncharacterized protein n=1 Tax=Hymenolepis diminuta TaxID=6216 RepID=A0A564YXM6_HYMDI|nr:unnamed protein product [Hymenolepis diminuta]